MFDQILSWALVILPAAFGFIVIAVPAKSENKEQHMRWRYILGGLLIAFGVLTWIQQSRAVRQAAQDRESAIQETSTSVAAATSASVTKTVTDLYSKMLSDQKDQIAQLQSQLAAQSKDVSAIKGSNIVTGKTPIKVEVTNPSPGSSAPSPQPPVLTGMRIASQKRIPSGDPKLPYGLEVVVQTDVDISPVRVAVVCDGPIGSGRFVGTGVYTMINQGTAVGHPEMFLVQWATPTWTPDQPIVVHLFSETAINAIRVQQY
jgi:hypothetical protein